MTRLEEVWNRNSFVTKVYGRAGSEMFDKMITNMFIDSGARGYSVGLISQKNGKLDYSVYNQVEKKINDMEGMFRNGINPIKQHFFMTSQSTDMHPVTHQFNKEVDDILNYERGNRKSTRDSVKNILDSLVGISLQDKSGISFNKALAKIESLNNAIREKTLAGKNADKEIMALKSFVNGDNTAKMVRAFAVMMDKYTPKAINDMIKIAENTNQKEIELDGVFYNLNTVKSLKVTVDSSKKFMTQMGNVNVLGLNKMKTLIDQYYKNAYLSNNPAFGSKINFLKDEIDNAIKRLKMGMASGNYYPHQTLTGLMKMEEVFSNVDYKKITKNPKDAMAFIDTISKEMQHFTSNILTRNEDARLYDLNAIKTIESYALNATQFNKTMSLFSSFMTMAKDLNPSHYKDEKLQDSIDSILDFMSVKLNSTLYGYKNANNAVKQAVSTITKVQTAAKMGLSLLGALRNATQFGYYVIQNGLMKTIKASSLQSSNRTYSFGGKDMTMSDISAYRDAGIDSKIYFDTIENISGGSLFNMNGVSKQSIKVDFDDGNDVTISYVQDGVMMKFDRALAEATGFGLKFHQISENLIRGKVYKDSFALNFNSLYESGFVDAYVRQNPGASRAKAEQILLADAKNAALNMVKLTQFDYSNFEKPQAFGGGVDTKSLLGNVAFQFMTFPAGMIKYNNKVLSEAFADIKHGNINTIKVGAASRLLLSQVFVGVASLLFNNDFSFMFTNDTYQRADKLYKFLTEDADKRKDINYQQGLLSLMTGPAISDSLMLFQALGMDWSDNEVAQLILGYQNLSEMTDDMKDKKKLQSVSVSLARLHKDYESLQNGDMKQIIANNIGIRTNRDLTNRSNEFKSAIGIPNKSDDRMIRIKGKVDSMTPEQKSAFNAIKNMRDKAKNKKYDSQIPVVGRL